MRGFIELNVENVGVYYVNPDQIATITAPINQPDSPVRITLVTGKELQPNETLQQVREQIDTRGSR